MQPLTLEADPCLPHGESNRFRVHRVELAVSDDNLPGSYTKSFRHFTRDALPRVDNYRNINSIHAARRPTLDELHNAATMHKVIPSSLLFH